MKFTKDMDDQLDLTNCDITPYEDDEVFRLIPDENNRWISNYGRVIGWSEKNGYVLEHICHGNTGINRYHHINSNTRVSKSGKSCKLYIHRLVADAFCLNDDSSHRNQVHHISKFNPSLLNEVNNRADNLVWVSAKLHSMLNAIESIYIIYHSPDGDLIFLNPFEAFERMAITDQEFCEYIEREEPIAQHKNYMLFECEKYLIEIKSYDDFPRVFGSYRSKRRKKAITA